MRSLASSVWLLAAALVLQPEMMAAQTPASPGPTALVAPANAPPAEQNPPAAVGEEGHKETRGFFSALGHNLADDVKHMPRRNSLYWLAGGTAMAFAIHPEDGKINRR